VHPERGTRFVGCHNPGARSLSVATPEPELASGGAKASRSSWRPRLRLGCSRELSKRT
jgi:hypothetical protein